MTKKNIKFSKLQFTQLLNAVSKKDGSSVVHYTDEHHHPHTLIAQFPKQTIHQTSAKQDPRTIIEQSLNHPNTVWVIATSYEWGCHQLGLPTPHTNAIFIEYQNYLLFNHATDMLTQVGHVDVSLSSHKSVVLNDIHLDLSWQAPDFSNAISSAQRAIREGDIYQINLSYPASITTPHSLENLYHHMQTTNAPLHGAWIQTNEWGIASASPEELFYLKNDHIRTRPIKGTIGRHHDPVRDQHARDGLKCSKKDHAELVMITDLMRNDLSQFSKIGSVSTTKLCDLVEFPYVYHLVSTVEAQISDDLSPLDILKQLAPGGSITGCPKRSACQMISQIESTPREFYTGHIGFISSSGEASFNVAIRTCYQQHQGPIITHAGCGITIDSIPTNEYQESLDKFRFLTQVENITA
jgi:para-aminobenzoate synthetase component 1